MELRDYLRVIRANWILIALSALIGVAVSTGYSLTATPQYQSTTKLYVSARANDSGATADLAQGTSFARQAVSSYVSVVNSASVLDRVIADLDLDTTSAALASKVSASSPANTVLIDITVTSEDPVAAAAIANSVGKNTAYVVTTKLETSGQGQSPVKVQTIQTAVAPTRPTSPRMSTDIALGLVLGLGVGVLIAFLRSVLDNRVRTALDIERTTDRPILGVISLDHDAAKRPLVFHTEPRSPRAESYRSLRTNLQFTNLDNQRSYVITSSVPREGKTTTSVNLAIALAETGARVALVDGDLRLPKVAERMGIEGAAGLTDVLINRARLADVLQRWGSGQLYVLAAGLLPPNPSELLGSTAMAALIDDLTGEFDYVLVDAPPILLVTDAAVISKSTGGVILTAACGKVKKNELAASLRALGQIGSHLAGIVFTMLPERQADSDGYGAYTQMAWRDSAADVPGGRRARRAKGK